MLRVLSIDMVCVCLGLLIGKTENDARIEFIVCRRSAIDF